MTRADMDAVRDEFVARDAARAPRPASTCSSCTWRTATCCRRSCRRSPTGAPTSTAARSPSRARFPLEVLDACRAAWPAEKPMSVRISATDWMPGGFDGRRRRRARARCCASTACDVVDVSTGQVVARRSEPAYGRSFQTPFADRIRNEVGIPTIAVGAISSVRRRQHDDPRRPRRPVRARPPAPLRPVLDAARRRRAGLRRPSGSSSTRPAAGGRWTAASTGPSRRRGRSSSTALSSSSYDEPRSSRDARPSVRCDHRRVRADRCDAGRRTAAPRRAGPRSGAGDRARVVRPHRESAHPQSRADRDARTAGSRSRTRTTAGSWSTANGCARAISSAVTARAARSARSSASASRASPRVPTRSMGEMEVGALQEEIAAKVTEIRVTDRRFWLRPFGRTSIRPPADRASTSASRTRSTSAGSSPRRSGAAAETLLDTYHAERHPVAEDVLDNTRAQMELSTEGAGRAQAAHRADGPRRGEPPPDREDHRDRHPLRRRRGPGSARPPPARHRRGAGPPLPSAAPRPRSAAGPHRTPDRRRLVRPGRPSRGFHGSTRRSVRPAAPDGHVAWIGDDQADLDDHLSRWFGRQRWTPAPA